MKIKAKKLKAEQIAYYFYHHKNEIPQNLFHASLSLTLLVSLSCPLVPSTASNGISVSRTRPWLKFGSLLVLSTHKVRISWSLLLLMFTFRVNLVIEFSSFLCFYFIFILELCAMKSEHFNCFQWPEGISVAFWHGFFPHRSSVLHSVKNSFSCSGCS